MSCFSCMNCSIAVLTGLHAGHWAGPGVSWELFQAPPATHVVGQSGQSQFKMPSRLGWSSTTNATALCHTAPRQEHGSRRKNPVRSCVGWPASAILRLCCRKTTEGHICKWNWGESCAVIEAGDMWPGCKNTHSRCFFIYLNFIYSAAVTGCSSFVYGLLLSFH